MFICGKLPFCVEKGETFGMFTYIFKMEKLFCRGDRPSFSRFFPRFCNQALP